MATLKMSGCMKIVSKMSDDDQNKLLARLDQYQADGVPLDRAQVMAAQDTLAEIRGERDEFMQMVREQHPDLFEERAAEDVEPTLEQLVGDPGAGEVKFSERRGRPPKKTVTAYKLFRVNEKKPGQLFPLFIGKNEPVEMGVWYDADDIPTKGFASRPGWHAGDLPVATHIGEKSRPGLTAPDVRPTNQVWAEISMSADKDWQPEANKRGTNAQGKVIAAKADIKDQIPVNGFYRYKTNPNMTGSWLIGGSIKVNRILSDEEVQHINDAAGVADLPREEPFDAEKYGFQASEKRNPLGFYSALNESIAGVKINSAPVQGWKDAIKGMVNKGQVKADEVEWSGINDWLDLQQGKVTREQVLGYLDQGGVQVEETVLGAGVELTADEMKERSRLTRQWDANVTMSDEQFERLQELDRRFAEGQTNPPKYDKYTLPGGENYREVLLTLPSKEPTTVTRFQVLTNRGELVQTLRSREKAESLADGLNGYTVREVQLPGSDNPNSGLYRSTHWNQPNVLAHIRVNDRTDADGKRVLFVEELQSDWGQEGKKKGFTNDGKIDIEDALRRRGWRMERARNDPNIFVIYDQDGDPMGDAPNPQLAAEYAGLMARQIPVAPFVTKTEGWLNLALKRVMVMAAEGGYDKVAFVNGEQSADRYDLSKQVDEISWRPASSENRATVTIKAGGRDTVGLLDTATGVFPKFESGSFGGSRLDEVVGKEIADKILAAKSGTLAGDGLKVGGEGMKTFYDTIVPTALKKLLPKVGGGQLKTVEMKRRASLNEFSQREQEDFMEENGYPIDLEIRSYQQLGFDVTDAMREKVAEGLPLFSEKRAQTDTPQFKRWFGDSKVVDADGAPLVIYRGVRGGESISEGALNGEARGGYASFGSDSPYVANTYGTPDFNLGESGALTPIYIKADKLIEFPVQERANGSRTFSKTEFDRRAQALRPGEVLVARQVLDIGPNSSQAYEVDKEKKYTHYSDIYAWNNGTSVKSATGNNGEFDATNPDIRESEKRIFAASDRDYTPEQRRFFANVGREVETPTIKERLASLKKDFFKRAAQGIADQFRPLRELSKEAYALARLSKGSAGAVEALLKHGKLKLTADGVYDADTSGGAIDRVFMPLGKETSDFLWWMAAHRADRLAKEDRENLFTTKDIAAGKSLSQGTTDFDYTLSDGSTTRDRARIYADTLAKYDEFNQNVLDIAQQSGLLSNEVREKLRDAMYVPFYRQSEDGSVYATGSGGGLVRQQAFKALKGGQDKLKADLLGNVLMNWSNMIDASAKNRAALASLEAAAQMGVATEAPESTAREMAASMGKRSNVVWAMDQGVKHYYLVEEPEILQAISSLQYTGMKGPLMDAMGTMKRWLTIGATSSPAFKIRNLVRDSITAVATSELSADLAGNVKQGFASARSKDQTFVSALAGGGLIRFNDMIEGNQSARVRQLIRMGAATDESILDSADKIQAVRDKFEKGFMAYAEWGNISEEVNRIALYKQLIDQGYSPQEANLAARDLMDFSMQGTWTSVRILTQTVPFLNARIQGLYKLGRAAKEDPARIGAVLGAVTTASLLLAAAYSDDDDWKKREDWDRDGFWWFKLGGIAYRIPKPFEIGAMATLAERGADFLWDKNMTPARYGKIVKDLFMDNLSMNPIPQAFKPVLDVYANKNSFTGRPIETMGMERLKADYRFTQGTSMLARMLSTAGQSVVEGTGLDRTGARFLSPVQIDALVNGYFSWLGSFVVGASDIIARQASGQPTRPTPDYFKLATGGIAAEVDSGSSYFVSALYNQAEIVEQAYSTWRQMLKEGRREEAADYLKANREDIRRYQTFEKVKAAETKYNEMIRMIERSSKDPDVKKAEIERIRERQDKMARIATEVR